jgi:hypothetical protein
LPFVRVLRKQPVLAMPFPDPRRSRVVPARDMGIYPFIQGREMLCDASSILGSGDCASSVEGHRRRDVSAMTDDAISATAVDHRSITRAAARLDGKPWFSSKRPQRRSRLADLIIK